MQRLPPPTPSPVSTYCSDLEYCGSVKSVGSQILRRSQRLIDKENQELAKTSTATCRSPQLFEESEDFFSQQLFQQENPSSEAVHLKKTDKVVQRKSVDGIEQAKAPVKLVHLNESESSHKVVHLNPSDKVLNLKSSDNTETSAKILHLKKQEDVKKTSKELQEAVPKKTLKRKRTYRQSSQPVAKKRAKTPFNRHEAVKTPLTNNDLSFSPVSYQSKLPPQYPEHFDMQLMDTSYVHLQARSAPARIPPREVSPTPELMRIPATHDGTWTKSSPIVDSESSFAISLSDSIGEIFGSKDINEILNIKGSLKYTLYDEHLPAVATMLDVDLDRLRNVLELTQRLTHKQKLGLPTKRKLSSSLSSSSDVPAIN